MQGQPPRITRALAAGALLLALSACFPVLPSRGGGQTEYVAPREVEPSDVALPDGYEIEVVATGLDLPTGVAFDDEGRVYVLEAGYSYGPLFGVPRLVRIEEDGGRTVVAAGTNPPWTGVSFADGAFYVAGGHADGGQLLRIDPNGRVAAIVDGLPSRGDHHTNGPVLGPDGLLYFGQGTTTNSGVVGIDNFGFGWVPLHPEAHDIPCEDVTLAGRNYRTPNPLTEGAADRVETGAFQPFGVPTEAGQVVRGELPCSGAVMRVATDGEGLELVAWGFRNPFGLAFSPDGALFVTENQFDVRGSRPVFGTGDLLWRVERGAWYGWPDYFAGRPLADDPWFRAPGKPAPEPLLLEHPEPAGEPAARLGVHSSSNGFDFSRNPAFGHVGEAFIAQFGDMAPGPGKVLAPMGFKVIRVDPDSGVVHDFAANLGESNGPASWLGRAGLERPVDARFDPAGTALYVVDFGVMTMRGDHAMPKPGTGVLWRIRRSER